MENEFRFTTLTTATNRSQYESQKPSIINQVGILKNSKLSFSSYVAEYWNVETLFCCTQNTANPVLKMDSLAVDIASSQAFITDHHNSVIWTYNIKLTLDSDGDSHRKRHRRQSVDQALTKLEVS